MKTFEIRLLIRLVVELAVEATVAVPVALGVAHAVSNLHRFLLLQRVTHQMAAALVLAYSVGKYS